MRIRLFTILAALVLGLASPVLAQSTPRAAPITRVEVAQLPPAGVASFEVQKAVDAYMARVSTKDKQRASAYFEGGYVLQVVDVVYALVVAGLLLWLGISQKMRALAERTTSSRFWQVPIYAAQYLAITTVAGLPLAIYENFIREHHYNLSNLTFPQWAGEFAISFAVQLIAFPIMMTIIYSVIRATKRTWWLWGTGVTAIYLIVTITIAPVFVAPLFNKYTPLPQSGMRSAILSLARANGVPAENVYVFDASKQSKRISANVSGMFGTTRVSLTDNLLNRCTPSEVLAVVGHEVGHYVLDHPAILVTWLSLVFLFGFFFVDRLFRGLVAIFGGNWGVQEIEDPAGLPLIVALMSVYFFLATPVTNTIIRTYEIQADIFGLNAVRQPDAFATVALKMVEYRKLDPSPFEEFVFYDHPSGRTRIMEAMRWKKEHLNDPDIMAGPISPQ